MNYDISPLSENAIVISFGKEFTEAIHNQVIKVYHHLTERPIVGMIEIVPTFTNITLYYDPMILKNTINGNQTPYEWLRTLLEERLSTLEENVIIKGREIVIPVCYCKEYGPDLEEVAKCNGLTPDEVIHIHTSGTYRVDMIGFVPGFPYLSGLSEKIAALRKPSPRLRVPAGSVAIAGKQTGIYPLESPGGWQIIGRTPISLFRPHSHTPSLLQIGDYVRFISITVDEYRTIRGEK